MRLGQVEWTSQPMLRMRLWYASLQRLKTGEALSSGDSAMELMVTPDRYRIAVAVCARSPSKKPVNKIRSKPRLIEVDCYQQRSNTPRDVDAQEPVENTHEVNFAPLSKELTKEIFNCRIFWEINKVVNVETQGGRNVRFGTKWIGGILNETRIEAWIFQWRSKTNRTKDCIYFVMPVTRVLA